MPTEISVSMADWELDQESLMDIRKKVFVEEQQVPMEEEIDGYDPHCIHVMAMVDDKVVGTARLLPNQYIGRMCVLKDYRGMGVGGLMLSFLLEHAREEKIPSLMLNAQLTALPFYQKYGFEADSEVFIEAGIDHKHMTLKL